MFGAYFILRVRYTHIDFLCLLFLVSVICPLIQEHLLPLKKLLSQAPEDVMLKIRRPVYKPLFKFYKSRATCRPKKRCKSNLSTVSVLASRSLHQDLMLNGCLGTTASDVCLQALTLSLPSPCDFFTLSPNREPVHRLYPVMVINTEPELRTILLQKVFFHFNRFEKQMDTRKV